MEIDAFLADSVVVSEGKLFVLGGGWSNIAAASLPVRHSRIGIGIILRVPYTATNAGHRQEIRLEDGDGREMPLVEKPPGSEDEDPSLRRVGTDFNLGRPSTLLPGEDQLLPFAVNIDGLVFQTQGSYRFVVSIDGEDVKSLPLRVVEAPQRGGVIV